MFDVAVVGSGHNGLITAAYLARAGHSVVVLERRPYIGGAVCTQTDLIEGYKIDVGSSAHVMIHQTPVLKELELHRYGLEYLEMDPWACYPLPGEDRAICFYRDVERTCESIAQVDEEDARAYREFVRAWGELNAGVFRAFLQAPTPWNLIRSLFGKSLRGSDHVNMVRKLMGSYGQLVCETFRSEPVRTAIIWLAAQSGPPPSESAAGDFAGWHAMYHRSGMKRARGGSGALTQALMRMIEAHGGSVRAGAAVAGIRTTGSGQVTGVELDCGELIAAGRVVAACHIKTTVDKLLADATEIPASLRKRVDSLRVGNGFGMIVRCAMSELPEYPGQSVDASGVGEWHRGLQLLCPSRAYLDAAYGDYMRGEPPKDPVPLVMTFSALDNTLAPPGKHVMFVWGQYHPYELRNGECWDAIREREADKLLAAVDRYAPGTSAKVEARYIQTPLDIERMHGMLRGNVMHLEMSFDQMFLFRPTPELSRYRIPQVKGLYLTGASTHPGGGVWGASGYNTAQVILKDIRRRRG